MPRESRQLVGLDHVQTPLSSSEARPIRKVYHTEKSLDRWWTDRDSEMCSQFPALTQVQTWRAPRPPALRRVDDGSMRGTAKLPPQGKYKGLDKSPWFPLRPTYKSPGLATATPLPPSPPLRLDAPITPEMTRLFVLFFAILSLICVIECTPVSWKRSQPSPKPGAVRRTPTSWKRAGPSPKPGAVRRTPTSMKRGEPSSKPGHVARGLCYFQCPPENMDGNELSRSSIDAGRLYCRYDVDGKDDKAFCLYNRVSRS